MNEFENDVLGFDPSQLDVLNQNESPKSAGNPLIYKTRPADSKSDDGKYYATIKLIYNPFNLKASILEQQSYGLQDENGWFTVVSSLTNNDTSCPIFKAWKKCHYAEERSPLWLQAASKDDGGKALFDKRFVRYVTVQIIEDKNQPELEGKYMFWKLPKAIWDIVENKMNPTPESRKPRVPIMDFLFGRTIDLTVTPGPKDPAHPEREARETKYSCEISEDIVSCTNPDGSPLLNDAEQEVLDTYVKEMKEVWRTKDPDERAQKEAEVKVDPNTKELQDIYRKVLENIKSFCPNLIEELGYKEWTPEQKARVNAWIDKVLNLQDPASTNKAPDVLTENTNTTSKVESSVEVTPEAGDDNDDLPF